jgi:outer membrane lipoprotein carrier protein
MRFLNSSFIIIFIWGYTAFFSIAYADSAADLTQLLNATQSMQARFNQTVFDNHGKAIQQSSGRMSFQRPGQFRWEVVKPIPQIIVANASRLWIYDPDLEQVTIRSLKAASGDAPALLLSHTVTALTQNYTVKTLQIAASDLQWFELIPKKSDSFASIQMGFAKTQINEMRLKDNLGHTTRIRFIEAKTNTKLSPALFIFKPKANVDVINETHSR